MLIDGEYDMTQASSIVCLVSSYSNKHCVETSQPCKAKKFIRELPLGKICVIATTPRLATNCPSDRNIAIEVYYQLPGRISNTDDGVIMTQLDVLEQILSEPFFDNLRTKQQVTNQLLHRLICLTSTFYKLGYDVDCSSKCTFGVLGFCFRVLSSTHNMERIQGAIFEFIQSIILRLNEISCTEFNRHIHALMDKLSHPPNNLNEASDRNWSEIEEEIYDFNYRQKQLHLLKESLEDNDSAFSRQGLSKFCSMYIQCPHLASENSFTSRILIVQSSYDKCEAFIPHDMNDCMKNIIVIEDYQQFISDLTWF
jgi:secreted Zn-dependent insulinase-like peptidase